MYLGSWYRVGESRAAMTPALPVYKYKIDEARGVQLGETASAALLRFKKRVTGTLFTKCLSSFSDISYGLPVSE